MGPELERELGRLVRAAQAEGLPGITAAVVRDGRVLWADAVGLADVSGERVTPDHQHRIGSITKTFTAVAVMQLRDAGLLALDDSLVIHLADAGRPEPTIRDLLSHLAGIQREPPGTVWETFDFPSGPELVARLADAEQALPAGRAWHYSNLAFALLGEVVERVGGMPYGRYVEERILRPLGMERTGFTAIAPVATPYAVDPYGDVVHEELTLAEEGSAGAAGSLWSTVGDLCTWASFLADPDGGVLDPVTVAEMAEVQAMVDRERWTLAWGLGLELWRSGDLVLVGHEGAMPGFLAAVFASRAHRVGAAALTNAGNRGEPGSSRCGSSRRCSSWSRPCPRSGRRVSRRRRRSPRCSAVGGRRGASSPSPTVPVGSRRAWRAIRLTSRRRSSSPRQPTASAGSPGGSRESSSKSSATRAASR